MPRACAFAFVLLAAACAPAATAPRADAVAPHALVIERTETPLTGVVRRAFDVQSVRIFAVDVASPRSAEIVDVVAVTREGGSAFSARMRAADFEDDSKTRSFWLARFDADTPLPDLDVGEKLGLTPIRPLPGESGGPRHGIINCLPGR